MVSVISVGTSWVVTLVTTDTSGTDEMMVVGMIVALVTTEVTVAVTPGTDEVTVTDSLMVLFSIDVRTWVLTEVRV